MKTYCQDFFIDLNTISIDRIALFASAKGAEIFLQEISPHYSNCIVASADGAYPKNPELRAAVFSAISNKPNLRLIVFNYAALNKIVVKSERIFVIDDLIMQDFKEHPTERPVQLHLDTQKIIFLMENFYRQWEKMCRIGNMSFAYENFREYNQKAFNWQSALLADNMKDRENQ